MHLKTTSAVLAVPNPGGERMIIGWHNFVDAMGRYKDEVLSSEGGLSI